MNKGQKRKWTWQWHCQPDSCVHPYRRQVCFYSLCRCVFHSHPQKTQTHLKLQMTDKSYIDFVLNVSTVSLRPPETDRFILMPIWEKNAVPFIGTLYRSSQSHEHPSVIGAKIFAAFVAHTQAASFSARFGQKLVVVVRWRITSDMCASMAFDADWAAGGRSDRATFTHCVECDFTGSVDTPDLTWPGFPFAFTVSPEMEQLPIFNTSLKKKTNVVVPRVIILIL